MVSRPIFVVDNPKARKLLPTLWTRLSFAQTSTNDTQVMPWDDQRLHSMQTNLPRLIIVELTSDKIVRTIYARSHVVATIPGWLALRAHMKVFVITPVGFGREAFEQPPPTITFLPSQDGEVKNLRYIHQTVFEGK